MENVLKDVGKYQDRLNVVFVMRHKYLRFKEENIKKERRFT